MDIISYFTIIIPCCALLVTICVKLAEMKAKETTSIALTSFLKAMMCVIIGIVIITSLLLIKNIAKHPEQNVSASNGSTSFENESAANITEAEENEGAVNAETGITPTGTISPEVLQPSTEASANDVTTEEDMHYKAVNAYSKWEAETASAEDMQTIVDYLLYAVQTCSKIQNYSISYTVPDCNSFYYIGDSGFYFEDLGSLCNLIINKIVSNQEVNHCGNYCITYCKSNEINSQGDNYIIQLSMEYIS